MSDDLLHEHADATLADLVAVMVQQMARGQQFYAYPWGKQWLIFWNGPVLVH